MRPQAKTSALLLLLMCLAGCSQPVNYAPVKTVNQTIAPNNGYVPYGLPHLANQKQLKQQPTKPTPAPSLERARQQRDQRQIAVQPLSDNSVNQTVVKPPVISAKRVINNDVSINPKFNPQKKLPPKAVNPLQTEPMPQNFAQNAAKNPQKSVEIGFSEDEKNIKKPLETSINENSPEKNNNSSIKKLDKTELTEKNSKKSIISIDNKKLLKLNFQWPLPGRITRSFAQTDHKGIEIAGETGQVVVAAEAGKAVYCGHGLAGFGNVAIIKHNETFLTAYANNSKLIVKEGQHVAKGQAIGHLGKAGLKKASLHFEIRKNGKPINPMLFLPKINVLY